MFISTHATTLLLMLSKSMDYYFKIFEKDHRPGDNFKRNTIKHA